MRDYLNSNKQVHFLFPIDGDFVFPSDGKVENGLLKVLVKVSAPEGSKIMINGYETNYRDGLFEAEIPFVNYRTTLMALNLQNNESDSISVFKVNNCDKRKYRVSSDDNIIFLADINEHKDDYKSIFENPYLKMYKRVHDATGACVHLNLFYSNDSLSIANGYFDLSMMTDKFKDEWLENSNWLRLSFHAYANEPLWPYKNTTYNKIYEECDKVNKEIIRFAGKATLAKTTTVHFGAINEMGIKAIRNIGYRNLAGYFEFDNSGNPLVAYHYPHDLITHVGNRDVWKDTVEDITFSRIDRVMNISKLVSENVNKIKEVLQIPSRSNYIEVMIHEQYFYENYGSYIPEFGNIVYECCKLLQNQGYESEFFDEYVKEKEEI